MLEEHMESMFKPTGTKIDMGKRTINSEENDVKLTGKVYETKKTSRAALQQIESSSSELSGAEDFEDDMEESD